MQTKNEVTNAETPVELMSRVEEYIGILEYIVGAEKFNGYEKLEWHDGVFIRGNLAESLNIGGEDLECNLEWMERDGLIEMVLEDDDILVCTYKSTQKGKKYLETKRLVDNFKVIYFDDGTDNKDELIKAMNNIIIIQQTHIGELNDFVNDKFQATKQQLRNLEKQIRNFEYNA